MNKLRINRSYQSSHPSNCPLIEKTADGQEVGVCCFFMPDGITCPRHGDTRQHEPDYCDGAEGLALLDKDAEAIAVKVCKQVEDQARAGCITAQVPIADLRMLLHMLDIVQHHLRHYGETPKPGRLCA